MAINQCGSNEWQTKRDRRSLIQIFTVNRPSNGVGATSVGQGEGHSNVVKAQGREEFNGKGGTVIQNCTITTTEDLRQKKSTIKTYLGRPWKNFSRTVFMQSFLDDVIDPEGWLEWEGNRVNTTAEDLVQILAEESTGKDIIDSGT
ncbi:hypothetical protein LWI28_015922 [Acer negundo]|uniref:Pectinesterase catalytic domain-containing protein n=1 Tax=Acer negundo TaxID=4023 RepID=A0AAD5NS93_ACENE|nr:hypothetical protein LWI28_015922 [Acer negundo]